METPTRSALIATVMGSTLEHDQACVLAAMLLMLDPSADSIAIRLQELACKAGLPQLRVAVALRHIAVRGLIKDLTPSDAVTRWQFNREKIGALPQKGGG